MLWLTYNKPERDFIIATFYYLRMFTKIHPNLNGFSILP